MGIIFIFCMILLSESAVAVSSWEFTANSHLFSLNFTQATLTCCSRKWLTQPSPSSVKLSTIMMTASSSLSSVSLTPLLKCCRTLQTKSIASTIPTKARYYLKWLFKILSKTIKISTIKSQTKSQTALLIS